MCFQPGVVHGACLRTDGDTQGRAASPANGGNGTREAPAAGRDGQRRRKEASRKKGGKEEGHPRRGTPATPRDGLGTGRKPKPYKERLHLPPPNRATAHAMGCCSAVNMTSMSAKEKILLVSFLIVSGCKFMSFCLHGQGKAGKIKNV